jgi:MYXO-CTERM domain-containing protein
MKISIVSGLALGALVIGTAAADPINYLGNLADGDVGLGRITLPGDGNGQDSPETWQWWSFFATAGDSINVDVDRLEANPDMVSATMFGGASLPGDSDPMTTILGGVAPAGSSYIASGDDDEDDGFGGPFGDPNYGFIAGGTGWYAVVVANFLGAGDGDYQIVVTGQTVPAPGSAVALLGLGGLTMLRRRR